MNENRCQSCAMPMDTGFYGTNEDGSENHEYCTFCFQKGVFSEPDLTLQGMIDKSVSHMTRILQYPEAKAKEMAASVIPQLKRWSKTA